MSDRRRDRSGRARRSDSRRSRTTTNGTPRAPAPESDEQSHTRTGNTRTSKSREGDRRIRPRQHDIVASRDPSTEQLTARELRRSRKKSSKTELSKSLPAPDVIEDRDAKRARRKARRDRRAVKSTAMPDPEIDSEEELAAFYKQQAWTDLVAAEDTIIGPAPRHETTRTTTFSYSALPGQLPTGERSQWVTEVEEDTDDDEIFVQEPRGFRKIPKRIIDTDKPVIKRFFVTHYHQRFSSLWKILLAAAPATALALCGIQAFLATELQDPGDEDLLSSYKNISTGIAGAVFGGIALAILQASSVYDAEFEPTLEDGIKATSQPSRVSSLPMFSIIAFVAALIVTVVTMKTDVKISFFGVDPTLWDDTGELDGWVVLSYVRLFLVLIGFLLSWCEAYRDELLTKLIGSQVVASPPITMDV